MTATVKADAWVATALGGPEKLAFCRELGADVTVDYTDGGFSDAVMDATFGAGVDVALTCWSATPRTSRTTVPPLSPQPAIHGNFSLCRACLAYAMDPLATRLTMGLNTVVTSQVSFDELPAAMERQERRETMGRPLVRVR